MKLVKKILYSFRYRIILLFTLSFLISVAGIGYFSISIVSDYVISNIEKEMEQTTDELSLGMNHIFEQTSSLMNLSTNSESIRFLTVREEEDLYVSAKALGNTYSMMRLARQIPDYVTDICVIGRSGNCYSERNGYFRLENPFSQYGSLAELASDPKTIRVYEKPVVLRGIKWEEESLALAKGTVRRGTTEVIGVIQICLDKEYISGLLSAYQTQHNSQIFITDAKGGLLFSSGKRENYRLFSDKLSSGLSALTGASSLTTASGEKYLVLNKEIPSTGWFLISTIPDSEVRKPAARILKWVYISLAGGLVFVILLNSYITFTIVHPIDNFNSLMKRAANKDFKVQIPVSKITEIESLYRSFETMVTETEALMQDIVQKQQEQKKMELQILQEQINPHFLYNSLESIIWAASNGKTDQVEELTTALAHFYRMVLSKGMDIVPLSQELSLVDNYLKIMKLQYGDLFDYSLRADPDTLDCPFPKMVLQPIVENSIYHGLQMKRIRTAPGQIIITVSRQHQNQLEIHIQDNGAGIEPELLKQINAHEYVPSGSRSSGYGLKNINQRIRLYFGETCGLELKSRLHEGTTVIIRVPDRLPPHTKEQEE